MIARPTPYASRTGTRRNLDALRAAGWRLIISPAGVLRTEGFHYALDNGAWSAFTQKRAWDEDAFCDALDRFGSGADFVVVPDIVLGGLDSLKLSRTWIRACTDHAPRALIAVQNGIEPVHVGEMLGPNVGLFVGGDTAWKERTMAEWAHLAYRCGSYCHVGRVNSQRRLRLVQMAGADSFDGSGPSRMVKHLEQMERGLKQACFRSAAIIARSAREVRDA